MPARGRRGPRLQGQGRQAGAGRGTSGFCVDRSQASNSRTPKTKEPGEESGPQPALKGVGHCLEERKADSSSRRRKSVREGPSRKERTGARDRK